MRITFRWVHVAQPKATRLAVGVPAYASLPMALLYKAFIRTLSVFISLWTVFLTVALVQKAIFPLPPSDVVADVQTALNVLENCEKKTKVTPTRAYSVPTPTCQSCSRCSTERCWSSRCTLVSCSVQPFAVSLLGLKAFCSTPQAHESLHMPGHTQQ